ncbi:MAG: TRIC cation channel family protein [Rhodospirillales bacterium]|nr:TRIC cation channel family protein [Rhodospirillales bacterium]
MTGRGAAARLLRGLDLAGTLVFALEGGRLGAAAGLDLLGIAVLAMATAFGGGVLRDVLSGAVPPLALRDPLYLLTALGGAALAVSLPPGPEMRAALPWLDALGLALFAVAGAEAALARGLPGLSCALLGALTAVGGGALRDVLLAHVPRVLRADFYASAALAGAAALVLARRAGWAPGRAAMLGGAVCLGLRAAALFWHWHLPHPG